MYRMLSIAVSNTMQLGVAALLTDLIINDTLSLIDIYLIERFSDG